MEASKGTGTLQLMYIAWGKRILSHTHDLTQDTGYSDPLGTGLHGTLYSHWLKYISIATVTISTNTSSLWKQEIINTRWIGCYDNNNDGAVATVTQCC